MFFKSGRERSHLAVLFMLGIGAVALGAFVGFLVNGPARQPPPTSPPAIASVVPPPVEAPPPAAHEFADSKIAVTPAAAPSATDPPPPAPAPGQLAAGEVREVQGRLRAVGFNPGPLDGSVGPLTANAARQYQRTRRMAVTGAVDRDLLGRLRQEHVVPASRRASDATSTAAAQPKQRNDFLASLDRLFHR